MTGKMERMKEAEEWKEGEKKRKSSMIKSNVNEGSV